MRRLVRQLVYVRRVLRLRGGPILRLSRRVCGLQTPTTTMHDGTRARLRVRWKDALERVSSGSGGLGRLRVGPMPQRSLTATALDLGAVRSIGDAGDREAAIGVAPMASAVGRLRLLRP